MSEPRRPTSKAERWDQLRKQGLQPDVATAAVEREFQERAKSYDQHRAFGYSPERAVEAVELRFASPETNPIPAAVDSAMTRPSEAQKAKVAADSGLNFLPQVASVARKAILPTNEEKAQYGKMLLRGLAESGYGTAQGVTNLFGAATGNTGPSESVRQSREQMQRAYGDPKGAGETAALMAGGLTGAGAQFMVPGALLGRAGAAAQAANLPRLGTALSRVANPLATEAPGMAGAAQNALGHILGGTLLNAPLNTAIAASPQDATLPFVADMTKTKKPLGLDPNSLRDRVIAELGVDATGGALFELLGLGLKGGARALENKRFRDTQGMELVGPAEEVAAATAAEKAAREAQQRAAQQAAAEAAATRAAERAAREEARAASATATREAIERQRAEFNAKYAEQEAAKAAAAKTEEGRRPLTLAEQFQQELRAAAQRREQAKAAEQPSGPSETPSIADELRRRLGLEPTEPAAAVPASPAPSVVERVATTPPAPKAEADLPTPDAPTRTLPELDAEIAQMETRIKRGATRFKKDLAALKAERDALVGVEAPAGTPAPAAAIPDAPAPEAPAPKGKKLGKKAQAEAEARAKQEAEYAQRRAEQEAKAQRIQSEMSAFSDEELAAAADALYQGTDTPAARRLTELGFAPSEVRDEVRDRIGRQGLPYEEAQARTEQQSQRRLANEAALTERTLAPFSDAELAEAVRRGRTTDNEHPAAKAIEATGGLKSSPWLYIEAELERRQSAPGTLAPRAAKQTPPVASTAAPAPAPTTAGRSLESLTAEVNAIDAQLAALEKKYGRRPYSEADALKRDALYDEARPLTEAIDAHVNTPGSAAYNARLERQRIITPTRPEPASAPARELPDWVLSEEEETAQAAAKVEREQAQREAQLKAVAETSATPLDTPLPVVAQRSPRFEKRSEEYLRQRLNEATVKLQEYDDTVAKGTDVWVRKDAGWDGTGVAPVTGRKVSGKAGNATNHRNQQQRIITDMLEELAARGAATREEADRLVKSWLDRPETRGREFGQSADKSIKVDPLTPAQVDELRRWQGQSEQARQPGDALEPVDAVDTSFNPDELTPRAKGPNDVPDVLYHGSPTKGLRQLDRLAPRELASKPDRMDSVGAWFAETPEEAGKFTSGFDGEGKAMKGEVYAAKPSINNPKTYGSWQELLDDFNRANGREHLVGKTRGSKPGEIIGVAPDGGNKFHEYLRSQGHDGFSVTEANGIDRAGGPQRFWVALDDATVPIKPASEARARADDLDPTNQSPESGQQGFFYNLAGPAAGAALASTGDDTEDGKLRRAVGSGLMLGSIASFPGVRQEGLRLVETATRAIQKAREALGVRGFRGVREELITMDGKAAGRGVITTNIDKLVRNGVITPEEADALAKAMQDPTWRPTPPIAPEALAEVVGTKVVDPLSGAPRLMVHGTPKVFEEMAIDPFPKNGNDLLFGPGGYTTNDVGVASTGSEYAAGATSPGVPKDLKWWLTSGSGEEAEKALAARAALVDGYTEQLKQELSGAEKQLAKLEASGTLAPDDPARAYVQRRIAELQGEIEVQNETRANKVPAPNTRPYLVNLQNPLNMDAPLDGTALRTLTKDMGRAAQSFTRQDLLAELTKSEANLSDDQVALITRAVNEAGKSMSSNPLSLPPGTGRFDAQLAYAALWEDMATALDDVGGPAWAKSLANAVLRKMGYDGITHVGGGLFNSQLHQVAIAFDKSQLVPLLSPSRRGAVNTTLAAQLAGASMGAVVGVGSSDDGNRLRGGLVGATLGVGAGTLASLGARAATLAKPRPLSATGQAALKATLGKIDFDGSIAAQMAKEGAGGIGARVDRALQLVVDAQRPLDTLGKAAEAAGLPAQRSPRTMVHYALSSDETVRRSYYRGIIDPITREDIGPSLQSVFAPLGGNPETIQQALAYVVQLRNVERMKAGQMMFDGDPQQIKAAYDLVQELGQNPAYAKFASDLKTYTDALGQYAVRSGLWTPELAKAILESDAVYVPFKRLMYGGQSGPTVKKGLGMANITPGVKRMGGSARPIADPATALTEYTGAIIRRADAYRVGASLFDATEALPPEVGATLLTPIPSPAPGVGKMADANLEAFLGTMGLNPSEAGAMADLWVPMPLDDKAPVIWRWGKDGKKEYAKINAPELYEAIATVGLQDTGLLAKILGPLKRITTMAATGINPRFALGTNIARDIPDAIAKNRGVTLADYAVGYAQAFKAALGGESALADQASRFGVSGMSPFAQPVSPAASARQFAPTSRGQQALSIAERTAEAPLKVLESFGAASDQGPRLARMRADTRQGVPTETAAVNAGQATVDFRRKGSNPQMRFLAATIPYLSASLNAGYRYGRFVRRDPQRALAATLATAAVAGVAAWAISDKDELTRARIKDRPPTERAANVTFPIGDEGDVVKLPIAPEQGLVASAVMEALLAMQERDPEMAKTLRESVKRNLPPGLSEIGGYMLGEDQPGFADLFPIAGVQGALEISRNRTSYGNRAIEPENLRSGPTRVSPEFRRTPNTSPTSIWLAEQARKMRSETSPIQADYFVRDLAGPFTDLGYALTDELFFEGKRKERVPLPTKRNPLNPTSAFYGGAPYVTPSQQEWYDETRTLLPLMNDYNMLQKQFVAAREQGDLDTAKQVRDEALGLLAKEGLTGDDAKQMLKAMKGFNDAMRQGRNAEISVQSNFRSGALTAEDARTQLDAIARRRGDIYRNGVSVLRQWRASKKQRTQEQLAQ